MKEFIFICLLAFGTVFTGTHKSYPADNELKEDKYIKSTVILVHSYVHILIDGHWWIYEYDEDGKLVNVFLDEE
jgi:hypothetical protein